MSTVSFQNIIVSSIGDFGRSQALIVTAIKLGVVNVGWAMVMIGFGVAELDWWKVPKSFNGTGNLSLSNYKKCPQYENETIYFDRSAHTMVNEWSLVCDRMWVPTTLKTVQMIGVLLGSVLYGQLGDWFGRKKSLFAAYLMIPLAQFLLGFSVNWQMAAVCGFLMGISLGGFLVLCHVYAFEFIGTKWRTIVGCIPSWAIGMMLLGGFYKLSPNWRHLCWANAALGVPISIIFCFCPESVRWLIVHGQVEEGKQVLSEMARRNKRESPDLSGIHDIVMKFNEEEKNQRSKYNYATLFRHPFTRWRAAVFGYIWFTMAFGYYAITFGVSYVDVDKSLNIVFQALAEMLALAIIPVFARFFGRKWSSFIFIMLTCLSMFAITIAFFVAETDTFHKVRNVMAIIAKLFLSAGWFSIILFTVEVFPTVVRSVSYGFASLCTRVGAILAPQNKGLFQVAEHLPYTVNASLILLSAFLCLFFKDTYSKSLDDYLEDESNVEPSSKMQYDCSRHVSEDAFGNGNVTNDEISLIVRN